MATVQFNKRKTTDYIIVHCAATRPGMDIGVREIRQWHVKRGFLDVGYHFIIRRNGDVENGRDHDVIGAHAQGFNANSIGICLVGGVDDELKPQDNFTEKQWASLQLLLLAQKRTYPKAKIVGHRDLDSGKACPSFDVASYLKRAGI